MAIIRNYEIFENVDYLENINQENNPNPRFTFFTKNLEIFQDIEDILNSVEDSVFTNTYAMWVKVGALTPALNCAATTMPTFS